MAEAQLAAILRSISGTVGNFNFRTTKNGIVIADRPRARTTPPSPDQLTVQAFFTAASKQWRNLTANQRNDWQVYAATFFPNDADGNGSGPSGQAIYLKAAWNQQAVGQPLPAAAPTVPPPAAITSLTIQPSTADTSLTVRIGHPLAIIAGFRIHVEITSALSSPARNPQPSDYRSVRGVSNLSYPALVASGSNVAFTNIRYTLPNAARFGCAATIINPSGIPGQTYAITLVQQVA